jgi:hypothetical protein
MRTLRGTRAALVALLAAVTAVAPVAHATPDSFGVGTGRDGALNVPAGMAVTVNRYASVNAAVMMGSSALSVSAVTGITTGTLVLVVQVKSGTSVSGAATAVDTGALGVGRYDVARVTGVMGTMLSLDRPLANSYAATGAQVVTIPEYTTVNIAATGSVVATAWNGTVGGVVAFLAQGTVTLAGAIRADAAGFRGGARNADFCNGSCTCRTDDATALDDPMCRMGGRGEGFDTAMAAFGATGCGVGNRGIGAGGGGHINAGGAGGGHAGAGGVGGASWCSGTPNGGRPGAAIAPVVLDTAITFGGGGGGGQQNNSAGTNGGGGGGIVFVRAGSLAGPTTGAITARGGDAANSGNDASGGGGAGGAVLLRVVTAMVCPVVDVSGGRGGTSTAGMHGGGGGGGAGRVRFDGAPMGCAPRAIGGVGDTTHPSATPGAMGTVETGVAFGCTTNAMCSGATPICDSVTRVCRPCSAMSAMDCAAPTPACAEMGANAGRCVQCTVSAQCAAGLACSAANQCVDQDTDMDGVFDRVELGPDPTMPRDTDRDGTPDFRDPDDDGDGVNTALELGPGGAMAPRNSDAMVPVGEGSSDMVPDYLDDDDDGDGIPTRVEVTLEGMTPGDADMVPAYLDRDSDGDGVADAIERGAMGATPANTDGAMDRADFLDLDSDNDCVADADGRELGAARTNPLAPSMSADSNCADPGLPVCDTTRGVCVARPPVDAGPEASVDASADASEPSDGSITDGSVTDGSDTDGSDTDGSLANDSSVVDAVVPVEDASLPEAGPTTDTGILPEDVASQDSALSTDGAIAMDARADGGATGDGAVSSDAGTSVTGDGACACRAPAAPSRGDRSALGLALFALSGALVTRARRRGVTRSETAPTSR